VAADKGRHPNAMGDELQTHIPRCWLPMTAILDRVPCLLKASFVGWPAV